MKRSDITGSIFTVLVLIFFVLFLRSPDVAANSVRTALHLCGELIIPSLLPFFILSSLISALQLPQLLGRAAAPVMEHLFHLPGAACVPLFLGLTGGYPIGAAAAAELTRRGILSEEDASRLLPFCNNTGPAFILGAAGNGVFRSVKIGILLYLCHIAAALVVGLLFCSRTQSCSRALPESSSAQIKAVQIIAPCIRQSVSSLLNVCGFVIFFAVIRDMIVSVGIFPALVGRLSVTLGWELQYCSALLSGLLELGGGIAALRGLPASPAVLAMASFLLGFGGLSVHCQTLSVLSETKIKCARHFTGRIFHGTFSALFCFVLSHFLL